MEELGPEFFESRGEIRTREIKKSLKGEGIKDTKLRMELQQIKRNPQKYNISEKGFIVNDLFRNDFSQSKTTQPTGQEKLVVTKKIARLLLGIEELNNDVKRIIKGVGREILRIEKIRKSEGQFREVSTSSLARLYQQAVSDIEKHIESNYSDGLDATETIAEMIEIDRVLSNRYKMRALFLTTVILSSLIIAGIAGTVGGVIGISKAVNNSKNSKRTETKNEMVNNNLN